MYRQIEIFSDLVALQLGIVHPTVACASKDDRPKSIDEALASMSEREARVCKRKFRKLLRQRSNPKFRNRWNPRRRRSEVMLDIRARAWSIAQATGNQLTDNDE